MQNHFYLQKKAHFYFQNFERLTKHHSKSLYSDSECALLHSSDNINFGQNTQKCQDHIVYGYDYKLICFDERIKWSDERKGLLFKDNWNMTY